VVAPCPIELPVAPSRLEARARLGVCADESVALVVARLIPGKRVDVALAALTLLGGMRVVVVGDGPLRGSLAARFPGAEYLGQLGREQTLLWIAAADVLVTASRLEGAPTVVREARALGTPVVAAPAGELSAWAAVDPLLTVISADSPGPSGGANGCRSF
jgi:teichuronic acid biosynthesis glycosyltransferase TuaC